MFRKLTDKQYNYLCLSINLLMFPISDFGLSSMNFKISFQIESAFFLKMPSNNCDNINDNDLVRIIDLTDIFFSAFTSRDTDHHERGLQY